ncbi:MAG: hypothetical protein CME70_07405 [Halobacteriovorax sp.]|nr:hypothetical protein [Halobacteriovorax sp.]|tara:strand:- start:359062 stop:359826 length:765 start_codon:yes stop_codon:yes gene_type:complete
MSEIITDHNDPRIKQFLGLKGITKDDYIIGEGFRIVDKMNQKLGLNKVLTSPKVLDQNSDFFKKFDCEILFADDDFISEHVGYKFHQGVFAIADHPGFQSLNNIDHEVLILNNLDNAENVGALIRSAMGLGFKNILVDNQSCSPYLKRAIRVSMGNVFFSNTFKVSNLVEGISQLRDQGYSVYSAANQSDAINYKDLEIKNRKIGIVIGNEGNGIAEEVKASSTGIIKIPVMEEVEHINAAAAGAVLMSYFSPI